MHYVDSIGFKDLQGFLDKEQERPSVLMNLKEKCDAPECNPVSYTHLDVYKRQIHIGPASTQYINPMDINSNYSEEDNPLALKADFILSLCEPVSYTHLDVYKRQP